MVGISRRPRCQSRSPRRRQNGRPHHPALGAPRLLQSQDLGLGRLSRPAPQAPPDLSRRVRLPLQPPPYPACRIPFLARHRRSPPAPDLQHVDLTGSKGISLYANNLHIFLYTEPLLLFKCSLRVVFQPCANRSSVCDPHFEIPTFAVVK